MKLLMSAFIVILLGAVLIRPVADHVELAKVSSITLTNESVTLSVTTATISNETNTLVANVTTLAEGHLTTVTAIRNISSQVITAECNATLVTGVLKCNETYSSTIYVDYTFNDYSTGTLANDELSSDDACRNSTGNAILLDTHCNVTLTTGAVKVNYDNFSDDIAYIGYKYEPDTYVHSSAARTLITLVILFFGIAVLTVGIGFAWKSFKDSGVI